jgi:hypothetical protein
MFSKKLCTCLLAIAASLAVSRTASAQVNYSDWKKTEKGNYYRLCRFPEGGHQHLVLFAEKPQWVYWYNPVSEVFWCCCPTIRHPKFADDVRAGKDQFLMATKKAKDVKEAEFPEDVSPNFKSGAKAKDLDVSEVELGCPPPDLPPALSGPLGNF